MRFKTFAASGALMALAALAPALAQEAIQAPAVQAPAAEQVPPAIQALGLEQLVQQSLRDGRRGFAGLLPDGTRIEARVDAQDALIGVWADEAALPSAITDALLPQAIRGSQVFGQFDRLEAVRLAEGRFDLKGQDADGISMRAQFDDAGMLLRFGREDEGRKMHEGRGGPRGDHGRGDHARGDHGKHEHGRGDHGRGAQEDRARGQDHRAMGMPDHAMGERGGRDMPRADRAAAADFDTVAASQRLTEAGYTALGLLQRQGPRVVLDATNPQGEPVTLELDRNGELVRESAR